MKCFRKIIVCFSLLAGLSLVHTTVYASSSDKDYTISNASWDAGADLAVATWDESEDKTSYKVQLYKGSKKIDSLITVQSPRYDFSKKVANNGVGSYTFTVYPSKGNKTDNTLRSDALYVDSNMISTFKKDNNIGQSSSSSSGASGNKASSPVVGWFKTGDKWQYREKGADVTRSAWKLIDNKWYYFDANGYMLTGWVELKEGFYLLGEKGDMLTGWQNLDNKWFYFDKSSGLMLTNTTTPDGYKVDASGAWIQTETN